MTHELLGDWKPSSNWYTPDDIWKRVYKTFETKDIFDPCPINGKNGLNISWTSNYIYINSPTPAAPWALKVLETFKNDPLKNIIFAAFSEAVLWQVPELLTFSTVLVRNRIAWIDGNEWVKAKKGSSASDYIYTRVVDGQLYIKNPGYMKPAKSPRNYNAFILLSSRNSVKQRFKENFSDLGFFGRFQKL